ncbi:redoxin domain-containing protein [Flaviaesturariibacter terrae]
MKRIASLFFLALALNAGAQSKPAGKAPAKAPAKRPASGAVATGSGDAGYEIKVTLKPFRNQWIYLGHYYGKQLPIIDSVKLNERSEGTFKGSKTLGGGIYLIGYPDRAHNFEILIDKNQRFSVSADTLTVPAGLVFGGSPENTAFHAYQAAMSAAGREADSLVRLRSAHPEDSVRLTGLLTGINNNVQAYRTRIMTQDANSLLATLLKAMKDPEMPIKAPKTKDDSLYNYRYYKNHFFDGIAFYDERLARTPFFESKVDRYFDQLVYPAADSVNREIDNIMAFAQVNKEMEKFFLLKFVNRYLNMKYMWEDKVFIHLYERYFRDKDYEWISDKGKKIVQDRAYSLYGNVLGEPASDIELPDSSGKKTRLYDVKGPLTLLVIWDPTCSHCKETLPKIDSMYQSKWKAQGVRIFSMAKETEGSRKDWTDFINKRGLHGWVNVYYSKEAEKERVSNNIPSYSQLFDVQSFPTILLLDADKRIVAKKISEKQADEIIDLRLKELKTPASK